MTLMGYEIRLHHMSLIQEDCNSTFTFLQRVFLEVFSKVVFLEVGNSTAPRHFNVLLFYHGKLVK